MFTEKTDSHPVWPLPGECLWGPWQTNTPMPKATQYRTCCHPQCVEVQYRDAPNA